MPKEHEYKKYAFYTILIILGYLLYKIILPYATYLALGIILSISCHPLYQNILDKTKRKRLSAWLTIIIILLIIVIPTVLIASALIKEAVNFINHIDTETINTINEKVTELIGRDANIDQYIKNSLVAIGQTVMSWTINIIGSATQAVIGILIMFSLIYYALIEGEIWIDKIKVLIPLSPSQKEKLLDKIILVTKTVINGELLIAAIQGILGGIIFYVLDIPNPVFWGFMTALLAFLPFVGSGMIWVPAAIVKLVQGEAIAGIFLLLYGAIVIGGVDYYIRPKIISGASRIHPMTALVGAFGGLRVFGFVGLVLGPLIAAIFEALIHFHYEDSKKKKR